MGPSSGADDRLAPMVGGSRVSGAKAMISRDLGDLVVVHLLEGGYDGDGLDHAGVPRHALEHRGDRLSEGLLTLEAFVESLADLGDGVLEGVEAGGDVRALRR